MSEETKSVNYQPAILVRSIQTLNENERGAIREALAEYICNHPGKSSYVQKIILDEMLEVLMWAKP